MILEDGCVIPHYLGAVERGFIEDSGNFTNAALRVGEVKGIIYPDSDESATKKYIEYNVEVQHRDADGPGTSVLYSGCLLSNIFGAGGDVERYTFRTDSKENNGDDGVGVGAKVLLMCVNGESAQTWIIGGVRDPQSDSETDSDVGHNYFWRFNGVSVAVNDDGEYRLQFKGKTKTNGDLADGAEKDDSGATLYLKKDGGVELFDGGGGLEGLRLSSQDSTAELFSDGTVDVKGPTGVTITSDQSINLDAANVHIGSTSTSEALVLGNTWRNNEQTLHNQLTSALSSIATSMGTLATQHGIAGASMASGAAAMIVPISGPIAASPLMAAAAASIISMTPMFAQIAAQLASAIAAITSYEAQAQTQLSQSHTTE